MPISISKYVNISSQVATGAPVTGRSLIGRLFTDNPLIPPGGIIEKRSLSEVGDYFGTTSEEYARAVFYFGWSSKTQKRAQLISFSRWVDSAVAPMIFGGPITASLSSFQAITTGAFALTIGGVTNQISGLNFSGAANFAAIATLIEDVIQTKTGTMWTAATVAYSSTTPGFNFVGGQQVAGTISVAAPSSGTDVSALIGWLAGTSWPDGPIFSSGSLVETITATLTNSVSTSNNFGSFLFIPVLTSDQIIEAAEWNLAQNFSFIYTIPVSSSNASTLSAALDEIGGSVLTLAPLSTEYPEQIPMQIFAATDYTALNAVQNYEFQTANVTPSVTNDTDSDSYDGEFVNYYGATQEAGRLLAFYQQGVMTGFNVETNARDINVYANEIWLKDTATVALMNLLLAVNRVSANSTGRAQVMTILQSVVNQALLNGTISVGGLINETQKVYIQELTGSDTAWRQIQNIGYYLNVQILQTGPSTYVANYLLVYKKDDVIRQIDGVHDLI